MDPLTFTVSEHFPSFSKVSPYVDKRIRSDFRPEGHSTYLSSLSLFSIYNVDLSSSANSETYFINFSSILIAAHAVVMEVNSHWLCSQRSGQFRFNNVNVKLAHIVTILAEFCQLC